MRHLNETPEGMICQCEVCKTTIRIKHQEVTEQADGSDVLPLREPFVCICGTVHPQIQLKKNPAPALQKSVNAKSDPQVLEVPITTTARNEQKSEPKAEPKARTINISTDPQKPVVPLDSKRTVKKVMIVVAVFIGVLVLGVGVNCNIQISNGNNAYQTYDFDGAKAYYKKAEESDWLGTFDYETTVKALEGQQMYFRHHEAASVFLRDGDLVHAMESITHINESYMRYSEIQTMRKAIEEQLPEAIDKAKKSYTDKTPEELYTMVLMAKYADMLGVAAGMEEELKSIIGKGFDELGGRGIQFYKKADYYGAGTILNYFINEKNFSHNFYMDYNDKILNKLKEQELQAAKKKIKDQMKVPETGSGTLAIAVDKIKVTSSLVDSSSRYQAQEGEQFVCIHVIASNRSSLNQTVSFDNFSLKDEKGYTAAPEILSYTGYPTIKERQLGLDEYAKGWVIFYVNKGDEFTLVYQGSSGSVNKQIVR